MITVKYVLIVGSHYDETDSAIRWRKRTGVTVE